MELELKILKEKVVEDEKKSGIGSLFDDEKTSHQHIQLLKTKYMQMRRDFDVKQQELSKVKLDVIGQQLIFDSQIKAISDQTKAMAGQKFNHDEINKKKVFELDKKLKEVTKNKNLIEADLRGLASQFEKESQENYKNKLNLDNTKEFGDLKHNRFNRDHKLISDFEDQKEAEAKGILDNRDKAQAEYMAMAELQKQISEAKKYTEEIEEMHHDLGFLQVRIKGMEEYTEYLFTQKDYLEDEKKRVDEQNEDLEKQVKAKEEANLKRLIAKIQRDKNPDIKELILREEDQLAENDDFLNKLRSEIEKTDQFLEEIINRRENKRLLEAQMLETKANI